MIQPPLLGVVNAASAVSARTLTLPCASRAAKLLYAVGVHGGTAAPGPQIAAARRERVRSLDPRCIAAVSIEYINVVGAKPGTLVLSPGGASRPSTRHRVPHQVRVMSIRKTGSLNQPSWIILASRLRLTCSRANPSYAARDFPSNS